MAQDSVRNIYQRAGIDLSKAIGAGEVSSEDGIYFFTAAGQHIPLSVLMKTDSLDINTTEEEVIFPQLKYTLHLKYLNISGANRKYGGAITHLRPLMLLKELTWLDISDNEIKDLTPLQGLTQLQYLDARQNQLRSLAGIERLSRLQVLLLGYGAASLPIKDLLPLKGKTALRVLALPGCSITDITTVLALKKLQRLDLSNNKIAGPVVLTGFMDLQELDLTHNRITRLEIPLMPSLKNLRVGDNLLTTLPSLSVFPVLENLSATFNSITRISCTTPLAHLTTIYLKGNKLQELSFIRYLPALREVDVCNNRIKDLRPLLLVAPAKMAVSGNPIDSTLLDDTEKKRLLRTAADH
ncbi:leucine-rich repeat domain-containing protein [Chitinophaga sp.]|uniref:leucine-rich repeat domain-containing protein n=1 Tax=Chitinophaga sp. TaxID=1869181 RepID=UPI002F93F922